MKILATPISQFVAGLVMAVAIMLYQFYAEIMPVKTEIKMIEQENAAFKLQLQAKKKILQQMGGGMSSQDFYTWFSKGNFSDLKLQALSGESQNIHIVISGNPPKILSFLQNLAGSRFTVFSFNDLQAEDAKLDMHFNFLKADRVSVSPIEKVAAPQVSVSQSQHVVGRIRKNGEQFCVIESGNKIMLRREAC